MAEAKISSLLIPQILEGFSYSMRGIEAYPSLPILLLQKAHRATEFCFHSELGDDFSKDKGVHVALDQREAGTGEVLSGQGQNSKEIEV